ncbi:MAG: TonB-dependent receptor [Prevotellaceae bacterium]|jgi:TonB-linked SusC/RagA family outer membrane protein|nr:TonB-dependent receptor [Prevotellaceae bacterium]
MNRNAFYSLLLCVCLPLVGFAQTVVVSGRVTDAADKAPLPGVMVQVQKTTIGVFTDNNGAYSITTKVGDVLTFAMMGMTTASRTVAGDGGAVDVELSANQQMLDEVVVVGYGVMKKRDVSGAVAQVKGDDLMKGNPASSINQAMQGKIAGVVVAQNDGAPGGGMSIQVRGTNSFSTSSQPLYVVDGIPFDAAGTPSNGATGADNHSSANALALINPNNIESIEILKDASATAIYGSRGANGVVLITTKKGATDGGNDKIEVSANLSVSTIARRVEVLNAYDYALYRNEQLANDGAELEFNGEWSYQRSDNLVLPTTGRYQPRPEDFLAYRTVYDDYGNSALVQGTDWQDEIYQTGLLQEYNVRVSGGGSQGWHSFSGNYLSQDGIIVGSGYSRYNLATNLGRKVHKWVEIGTSISFTNSTTDFASNTYNKGIIRSALMFLPTANVSMEPSAADELGWLAANPYLYVTTAKDQMKQLNIFTSSFVELTFTDWLKFRQNLGLGYTGNARSTYYGRHTQEGRTPTNGVASQADNWWQSTTSESLLTFYKTIDKHSLNVVAGFTYEEGNGGNKTISSQNFPSDQTEYYNLSAGLNPQTPTSGRQRTQLVSLLGRANYVYNDKYILTASFRRDGSSKFARGNKFANFASGALAWRISEEELVKQLNLFSNLKLRLSYGQTGNQGIGSYETLPMLAIANYPVGGSLASGYAEEVWRGPLNPDLKWEVTDQYNAALDIGLAKNRINITVEGYYKKTDGLLQMITIPSNTGFSTRRVNSGNVANAGLELSGNFVAVQDYAGFSWSIDANISFNRNEIGGLEGDQFATSLWSSADQVFIQRNGLPIGAMYGYVEDGFWDNVSEVRAFAQYKSLSDAEAQAMVGEIKRRDLNGDGQLDAGDRTIIGNTNPDFVYGLTSNMAWRGLTLSIFVQGAYGNDIFNGNLMDIKMANHGNIPQFAYDSRWTPDNTANAKWPRPISNYNREWFITDRYVEDGSYLRLKNVSLSYTIPVKIKGIESINVYASATNLLTLTRYSWFDPDVNAFGDDASRRGVDIYSYPSSRTVSLGAKITF